MDTLILLYMVTIVARFIMYICLSILIVNLYRNIEQFSPESKKVRLDELVEKFDGDEGRGRADTSLNDSS